MSTAVGLLWSWVWIPLEAWMFVCCVCCHVEVSATSWSLVQRSPTICGALLCVIKERCEQGGHSPRWAAVPEKIIIIIIITKKSTTPIATYHVRWQCHYYYYGKYRKVSFMRSPFEQLCFNDTEHLTPPF
jgi:hypothetical protein